jgi:hypothetical protein
MNEHRGNLSEKMLKLRLSQVYNLRTREEVERKEVELNH